MISVKSVRLFYVHKCGYTCNKYVANVPSRSDMKKCRTILRFAKAHTRIICVQYIQCIHIFCYQKDIIRDQKCFIRFLASEKYY
jgi:hypothetical protein